MMMAREGLRTKLRSAIHKALRESGPVTLADAQVKRNGDSHPVIVTIRPVQGPQGADGLLLVTFQDSEQGPPPRPAETAGEESVVRQLEYELKATREDLQSTIEELESSNEELKVSNEEIMSMNEELQSANEELETSKEELQSLNEELSTVNNQLQDKVADLETANNDMANLLNCTDVGDPVSRQQIPDQTIHAPGHPAVQPDCHRPRSAHRRHHAQISRQHSPARHRTRAPDLDASGKASSDSGRLLVEPADHVVSDAGQSHRRRGPHLYRRDSDQASR